MDRKKVEKAIRMGLQLAAGKPLDEAVAEVMECLDLVLPQQPDNPNATAAITANNDPPKIVPAPATSGVILTDLAPIDTPEIITTKSTKVRQYWSFEDLQNKVLAEAPIEMDVMVAGRQLTLKRIVGQMVNAGSPPGLQLGYAAGAVDQYTPYPKTSFWTNEENVDVAAAIQKIRDDAPKYYQPAKQHAPPPPVVDRPIRFSIGAEESNR